MALANVALTDTFDTWRIRTNQLCVLYDQANTSVINNGLLSNLAYNQANAAYNLTNNKIHSVTSNGSGRIWANNTTDGSNNKLVFIDLATSGVSAGSYGGSSTIPVITVDAYGRITTVSTASVTSMDYVYADAVGTSANLYSTRVGAASNTWANNVGVSANAYALSISGSGSASSNAWANTVGTAGNNYTNSVGAASNTWANTVGIAGNNYTNSVGTAGNNYTNSVGTAGNNYTNSVGAASNTWANTVGTAGNNYTNAVGAAGNNFTSATYLKLAGNQTITGGFSVSPYAQTSSSFTVNPALGNYQYISSLTGTVIITAPASNCAVDIMITNNPSVPPTLIMSGFTDTSGNNGDTWSNGVGKSHLITIRKINNISTFTTKAMQP